MKTIHTFHPFTLLLAAMALLFLASCGFDVLAQGSGDATETGNARVSGHLMLENGQVAEDAEILILKADYNPVLDSVLPDSQRVRADEHGAFHFKNLNFGTYNIQIKHPGTHTVLLLTNIMVTEKKNILIKDTLRAPGSLSVPIPETGDSGLGFVFLPGTTFKNRIDSEIRIIGKIQVDSIPSVLIPTVAYTKGKPNSPSLILTRNILVTKGAQALVPPFPGWSHVAKIQVNASASGLALSKDLYGFPMLVRLTAPQFDFSQTQVAGTDIRFAKADGTPLVREIEAWDAQSGHAEIWVRMDTVHAGSNIQALTMHWGNPMATAPASPFLVFDSSIGFSGVWHLGEEKSDTIANGLYRDATGRGNSGNDRITSTRSNGVIAGGHGFDSADYIEAPLLSGPVPKPNAFTISIWFRSSHIPGFNGGEMLSVGDNFGLRLPQDGRIHAFFYPPTPPVGGNTDWYSLDFQSQEYVNGSWHLAASTFDGTIFCLYIDGLEVARTNALGPVGYLFPLNATIGKHGHLKSGYEFSGDLDEAQIHSVARSQDWTRLSFENQKPGATFPTLLMP